MTYLKDFEERINRNDYPGFLKLWEEYCYIDVPNEEEFCQILNLVKESNIASAFGSHVEKGLNVWKMIKDTHFSHEILKLIFDIQNTNSETLSDIAFKYLEQKYPNDPLYSEKIRLIGLRQEKKFQGAISNYELLTHLSKGKFVFHKAGWGTCEILDVSMIREEVTLECDLVVGQKVLPFSNAFNTLIPLSDDHFLSQRFGNPDLLEEKAKQDPVKIIHALLRDLGPKTAYEIKEELLDLVIPEKDWNKWWQGARAKLKKDTKVETPKSTKEVFILRDKGFSFKKSFQEALEKKPSVNETIQMVYTFLRDFPETIKESGFKKSLILKLKEVLQSENLNKGQQIQLYFFLVDLSHTNENKEIKDLLSDITDFYQFINQIEIISFKKRALIEVKNHCKEWEETFLNLLLVIELNILKDYLFNELKKSKDLTNLKKKLDLLLTSPLAHPETLVWYFQKINIKKEDLPFSDRSTQTKLFENFLILLAKIDEKIALKDLGKKMINILLNDRYKVVRDIFEKTTKDEAQEYILLSTKCNLLSDHDTKIFQSLAEVTHPTLKKSGTNDQNVEGVIWTTQKGYNKVQQRLSQIASTETVENAKEIEEARALGDLRENAEFKAALEKRDRLQSELKLLSDQLNKAEIIIPEDVETDKVSVGCLVQCENASGKVFKFAILGPWDADPEKNILSFQSKIAQEMLDKKIGDQFDFQGEKYFIKKISNYFEQK